MLKLFNATSYQVKDLSKGMPRAALSRPHQVAAEALPGIAAMSRSHPDRRAEDQGSPYGLG